MTRLGSLDPGSGSLGLVCTDGDAAPLTYVASLPIRVAVDGRKVSPQEEAVAAYAALQWLLDHGVTSLVIERGRYYSPDGLSQAAQTATGEAYAVTRTVAGNVALLAAQHGITVEYVARQTWAHRLCAWWAEQTGEPRPQHPQDADIARAVPVAITGWPAHTSTHERDAAGALAWAVLPEPKKRKRVRASGGKRKSTPPDDGLTPEQRWEAKAARKRAEAARRIALRFPVLTVPTHTPNGRERVECPRCGRVMAQRDDGEIRVHRVSAAPDAAWCEPRAVKLPPPAPPPPPPIVDDLNVVAVEIDALVTAGDLAAMVAWCERHKCRRIRGVDRGKLFRAMAAARDAA